MSITTTDGDSCLTRRMPSAAEEAEPRQRIVGTELRATVSRSAKERWSSTMRTVVSATSWSAAGRVGARVLLEGVCGTVGGLLRRTEGTARRGPDCTPPPAFLAVLTPAAWRLDLIPGAPWARENLRVGSRSRGRPRLAASGLLPQPPEPWSLRYGDLTAATLGEPVSEMI